MKAALNDNSFPLKTFITRFPSNAKRRRLLLVPPVALGELTMAELRTYSKGPEKKTLTGVAHKVRNIEAVPWRFWFGIGIPNSGK